MCVKRCNSIILAIHLSNGISGCLLLRLRSCDAGDISSGKLFGLEVITNESYDRVISVALAMDLHWQSACRDARAAEIEPLRRTSMLAVRVGGMHQVGA